jgi:hypothetical protein
VARHGTHLTAPQNPKAGAAFFPGLAYPALAPFTVDKSSKHLSARPTLTPHDVAISRATDAAKRLDEYLLSVRGTGTLKEFNRADRSGGPYRRLA